MSTLKVDKIVGVVDPDAVSLPWKTSSGLFWFVSSAGAGGNYELTMPETMTSYEIGASIAFKATTGNTGSCQVNVDGLGFVPLVRPNKDPFEAGDIPAGSFVYAIYDGDSFVVSSLVGPGTTFGGGLANIKPIANFTYSANSLTVTFTNTSSDPDGTLVSHQWDFGDGNTSSLVNPTHTFGADGTYSVSLTVTDSDGATTTATQQVTVVEVLDPPTAGYNLTVSGFDVTAVDTSIPGDGTITSWSWDWGDSNTDTGPTPPTHTYASAGTYTITLTVTDSNGNSDSHSTNVVVPLGQEPTAQFSVSTSYLTANFTDLSLDPDGTITAWSWDFGDGSTSTQANPSHTYATGGTYTVQLTVTDNTGLTASTTQSIVVSANQGPTASFTVSQQTATGAIDVTFTNTSSDPDGSIVSYFWDFGDGNTSTQANPTHTYTANNTYTVSLTVTDDQGATDTAITSVPITLPSPLSATYSTSQFLTVTAGQGTGVAQKLLTVTPSGGSGSYSVKWTFFTGDANMLYRAPFSAGDSPYLQVLDWVSGSGNSISTGVFGTPLPRTDPGTYSMQVHILVTDVVTNETYSGSNINCTLTVQSSGGGGGGGGCLDANMVVAMSDGSFKRLGDIEVGDTVKAGALPGMVDGSVEGWNTWSTEDVDGLTVDTVNVVAAKSYTVTEYYVINDSIKVTFEHYVLVKDATGHWRWKTPPFIRDGNSLLMPDGSEMVVATIERRLGQLEVVNINVEDVDTYFVGTSETALFLAHNVEKS